MERALSAAGAASALALVLAGCDALSPTLFLGRDTHDAGRPRITWPDAAPWTPDAGHARDAAVEDAAEPLPFDLVLEELHDPPEGLSPGEHFTALALIASPGPGATPPSSVRFHLVPLSSGLPTLELGVAALPALGPGETHLAAARAELPVVLAPARYRLEAMVDPDDLLAELDEDNNHLAAGSVWVSTVRVHPASIDFGLVGVDCEITAEVFIDNRGAGSAYLGALGLASASDATFTLAHPPVPAQLGPSQRLAAEVTYAPTAPGSAQGVLRIDHDQILVPVEVPLAGTAEVSPRREERVKQLTSPRVDILFVIDDSQSMVEEQRSLASSASAYLDHLRAQNIDFHLAVTTTDVSPSGPRGAFVGATKVITPQTPNAGEVFAENVLVGTSGAALEQGLEAMRLALSEPLRSGVNAGFLRPDASLAVIVISDEDDGSPGTVLDYQQFLFGLKTPGDGGRVVVNAVVAPPERCATAPSAGLRYLALVESTGGVAESICEFDWTTALRTFPNPGFGYANQFFLIRRPEAVSRVLVNGVELPRRVPGAQRDSWRWDEPTNSIIFEIFAVPEPGAEITVELTTRC